MATTQSLKNTYVISKSPLGILDTTAKTFTEARATHAAASLAYYTFFSLFPLLLFFIIVGSYFLDRQGAFTRVTQAVQSAIPISQQFITENLQKVLSQRAAVGIFVLVSLLWSASSVFNNLAYEINLAWPEAHRRNFLQERLVGLEMIAGLIGLLIVSVVLDWLANTLSVANLGNAPFTTWNIWRIASNLGSWLAVFLLFLALYRWVPTVHVSWSATLWGAMAASIGWKAATTAFAWYLNSGFARYQLVYGSLGAVVAFLFVIYLIAVIALFGAHLTAAVDHWQKQRLSQRLRQTAAKIPPDTRLVTHPQGTEESPPAASAERRESEGSQPEPPNKEAPS